MHQTFCRFTADPGFGGIVCAELEHSTRWSLLVVPERHLGDLLRSNLGFFPHSKTKHGFFISPYGLQHWEKQRLTVATVDANKNVSWVPFPNAHSHLALHFGFSHFSDTLRPCIPLKVSYITFLCFIMPTINFFPVSINYSLKSCIR